MNKKEGLSKFNHMARDAIASIQEFGTTDEHSVVELTTLIWAFYELTPLTEADIEPVIHEELGFTIIELFDIEEDFS